MPRQRKLKTPCIQCGKDPKRSGYTYCSNACQFKYQRKESIAEWQAGKVSGLQALGIVSGYVKVFLRDKFGNKCCLCGWAEVSPYTGKVPLVADHIDGNWQNNVEHNLRLICPNCDSLSATYAGLNRGKGRKQRVLSKRIKEGRIFVNKKPR